MPLAFGGGGSHASNGGPSSGRKSPDPFKRFRRNSSSTLLSTALPGDASSSASASRREQSGAPPPPPPKPSMLAKPAFARVRKAKPASLSLLGSGDTAGHRISRPLDPSFLDEPKEELQAYADVSTSPTSSSRFRQRAPASPRKGTQAWYQAQQKTIDLGGQASPASVYSSRLSSLPLTASSPSLSGSGYQEGGRISFDSSPASAEEQAMIVGGVQIIKRRDADNESVAFPKSASHPSSASVRSGAHGALFVEPAGSAAASASGHASSVEGHNSEFLSASSSTYSLAAAATGRTSMDYPGSHAHGSGQLSSGPSSSSYHPPRPATSLSSYRQHDDRSNTSLPSYYGGSSGTTASPRLGGYLSPTPGTSAHPYLNKHAATMGKASAGAGNGASARHGLVNYFGSISSPSSATQPSHPDWQSSGLQDGRDKTLGPPAKPPRPKRSVLEAFNQASNVSGLENHGSTAPSTAPVLSRLTDEALRLQAEGKSRNDNLSVEDPAQSRMPGFSPIRASSSTPLPPPPRRTHADAAGRARPSAGAGGVEEMWNSARGQSANGGVATALGQVGMLGAAVGRRGWEFVRTLNSGGSSSGTNGNGPTPVASSYRSTIPVRAPKTSRAENAPNVPPLESETPATRQWLLALEEGVESSRAGIPRRAPVGGLPVTGGTNGGGHLFGRPLREAVLRSRLLEHDDDGQHMRSPSGTRLSIPDLGHDFSVNMSFLDDQMPSAASRRASRQRTSVPGKVPASRDEARAFYLPGLVVRCIQSLERWGIQEEGIYRLTGRSSHTAKLRHIFDEQKVDLDLAQIGPADLDINSVCSLLKSYLRDLPDTLIPASSSAALERAAALLLGPGRGASDAPGMASTSRSHPTSNSQREARTAGVTSESVSKHLVSVVASIPSVNWYLLREICTHLGELADPKVVVQTKMPLSNLCLILAPTLSLSVGMLKLIVEFRADIFIAPGPVADVELDAVMQRKPPLPARPEHLRGYLATSGAAAATPASSSPFEERSQPPTPSRLPQRVRKRSSTASLASLLSGGVLRSGRKDSSNSNNNDASSAASPSKSPWTRGHQSKNSFGKSAAQTSQASQLDTLRRPASPLEQHQSPALYERPSTSLGHFDEIAYRRRDPFGLGFDSSSPTRIGHSRQAASRYGDTHEPANVSPSSRRPTASRIPSLATASTIAEDDTPGRSAIDEADEGPPIARYYARLRGEAATPDPMQTYRFGQSQSDRSLPVSPASHAGSSIPVLSSRSNTPLPIWSHRQKADPTLASSSSHDSGLTTSADTTPMAHRYTPSLGGGGALDRPRPPTNSQRSFFSARERRKNSVSGLDNFVTAGKHARGSSKGSSGAERSRETSNEGGTLTGRAGTDGTARGDATISRGERIATADGASAESVRPLNISKKSSASIDEGRGGSSIGGVSKKASTVSSSCSTNTVSTMASSSVATHDTPLTYSSRSIAAQAGAPSSGAAATEADGLPSSAAKDNEDRQRLERDAAAFGRSLDDHSRDDMRSDIERYLDQGPISIHDRRRMFEQHAR